MPPGTAVKEFMPTSSRRAFVAAGLGAAAAARFALADNSSGLPALTLKQACERIRSKKVSPVDLTEACLDRIKIYNPKIDAWITVIREGALAQAKALEKEQAAGHLRSPLHGIPIGLKDNIETAGVRTTAGSKTLAGNIPAEDAEVTRRLKAAGAIVIGKCNMHIFASGATSAVSYYGPVRNPWNLELIAGGSSGGSAAAVAMDNCYAALGTDTGGSIRTPSAMCGVVGFKPTYGRVSIRGIVPLTWSLDHCGPIARTVEDTAMVLQVIAGYDRLDLQSIDYPVPDYSAGIGAPVSQFRIGIPPMFYDGLEDEVAHAMEDAIALLNKITKGSQEVEMPSILDTGAGSEGSVYREALGSGFVGGEGAATGGGAGLIGWWRWQRARGGLHPRMAQPAIGKAQRGRRSVQETERRLSDYAYHPRAALDHRRGTGAIGQRAGAQSEAGKYALSGRLRIADHHASLRLFESRAADRSTNQWTELSGDECTRAGLCLSAGHRLAHAPAAASAGYKGAGAFEDGGESDG
jgi:Asp-tRNA(Asn)/Glu-tRNA(Gln) amidotransferase A subunit family amidase